MKIKVDFAKTYVARIPVWLGEIKYNMVWKGNQVDFEQTRSRARIKQHIKDQEELERRLKKWSKEMMGA